MKTYYQLTSAERLALTNEELSDIVKVTAIEAGITPPMNYSDALNAAGYSGFRIEKNVTKFFEVHVPAEYNGTKASGLAFGTLEEAEAFLSTASPHFIGETGYGSTARSVLLAGAPTVKVVFVGPEKEESYGSSIDKATVFDSDDGEEAYDKFCKELEDAHATLRQEVYNAQARWEKRAEYVRLAGGDETIAAAFWSKAESGEFPAAEEPELKIS
jgi:hypothetical protein